MKEKTIAIVGGGSSGWITALYAKKAYPTNKIILIESDEIGILGAGEGATPSLVSLFDFLEIPFSDLVINCKATVKNGIKFSNWSQDGGSYFHPFLSTSPASNDYNFFLNYYLESDTAFSHIYASEFDHRPEEYVFMQKMSENYSVPFIENKVKTKLNFKFENVGFWSLHFNASMLAEYLKKIGQQRGIIRKEGVVTNITTDSDKNISELKLYDECIKVDFVFDCTGFKRLIIGNFYKSKWISHSQSLPVKKAIPFFLPIDKKIPPYTEAIAMKYGWLWKIPTQDRYGCGYAFDSDFISEEDAKKEINEFLGFDVESPKTFSFTPGVYEKIWIKNCLAVGLSTGFIEPLEATSLMQLGFQLRMFFSLYDNENSRNFLNNYYKKQSQDISDFIYLHYVTNKKNTPFWKDFTKNNIMPDFIKNILETIKEQPIDEITFKNKNEIFNVSNYFYILIGNKIIKEKDLKNYLNFIKVDHSKEYLDILKNQHNVLPLLLDHNKFIEKFLKNEKNKMSNKGYLSYVN